MAKKFLLTLMVSVMALTSMTTGKPSPEMYAAWEKKVDLAMNEWLDPKPSETQSCLEGIVTQINECRTEPYNYMIDYSVHGLSDLGSQEGCLNMTDTSYIVMSLNVSTTPVFFR